MKKKVMSALTAGVLATAMIAGCGSTSSGSTSAAASAESASAAAGASTASSADTSVSSSGTAAADVANEDEHTLSVYAWDKNFNIPALEAAEKAYQEKDPDFKLNIIEQPQASDIEVAITLAGSSGDYSQLPDIVLFQDHYIQRYVHDYPDAWVSVDDAGVNWDDFGAEKLSYSTIDGVHYGFPVDNGTVIMAYRTDILAQCGYTVDDMTGISWDTFDEIGKEVYEKTGKYLLSFDGSGDDLPYMMLQAEGVSQFKDGEPYMSDNQTFRDVIELIVRLQQDHVLYLANDWTDYTNQTIMGDMVAGVMNGNWIIPTIEQVADNSGKWEIASMPTLKDGEGYASNGGASLYITGNCTKQDLAKDFLAYTFGGGKGSQETYDNALLNGGVITCCISAGKSDVYQKGVPYFNDQPIYAKIVEMGAKVKPVEQSDYHYTAREQVSAAIQNIINGADIDQSIQDAEDQVKFAMDE